MTDDSEIPDKEAAPESDQRWLTPGVGSVAAASFFSDSGHEIATAVLPSFLTSVLHGSAASLGLIEGVSDALTGVAKLIGGPLANDPQRRRTMATGGYLATAVATGGLALIGFGLNAVVDSSASAILIWRFHAEESGQFERAQRAEDFALRVAGVAFILIALYLSGFSQRPCSRSPHASCTPPSGLRGTLLNAGARDVAVPTA